MVRAADQKQARNPADCAGEKHRAEDYLFHLNAHIPGGPLALAHNGDLIAMLAVIEINIHCHSENGDNEDIEQIFIAADLGQPSCHCALIDNADLARALGNFPKNDKIGDQLSCHVVHHQREKGFVRVPFGFENGRDKRPYCPRGNACNYHGENQKPVRQFIGKADHTSGGGKTAHEKLALAADVPEAHFEGGRNGQGHA